MVPISLSTCNYHDNVLPTLTVPRCRHSSSLLRTAATHRVACVIISHRTGGCGRSSTSTTDSPLGAYGTRVKPLCLRHLSCFVFCSRGIDLLNRKLGTQTDDNITDVSAAARDVCVSCSLYYVVHLTGNACELLPCCCSCLSLVVWTCINRTIMEQLGIDTSCQGA